MTKSNEIRLDVFAALYNAQANGNWLDDIKSEDQIETICVDLLDMCELQSLSHVPVVEVEHVRSHVVAFFVSRGQFNQ